MKKTYVTPCEKLLLSNSGIMFVNGEYSTDDPREQKTIENSPSFGKHIFLFGDEQEKQSKSEPPKKSDDKDDGVDGKQEQSDKDGEVNKSNEGGNIEIHKCEECGKEFGSAQALNGHMISHRRNG